MPIHPKPSSRSALVHAAASLVVATALVATVALPVAAVVSATTVSGRNGLEVQVGPDSVSKLAIPLVIETSDGVQLVTYCVQSEVPTIEGTPYTEGDWAGIPNIGNVTWILNNSVPAIDLASLTDAVEAHAGVTITPDYDEFEGNGITQLAIWAYTDGFDFSTINVAYDHVYNSGTITVPLDLTRLQYLFDYLTDPAVNTGASEPPASLDLDDSAAVHNGGRYGPISLATTAATAALSLTGPAGSGLIDATGAPITSAVDGDSFYVSLPPDQQSGTLTVSASTDDAELFTGRLFLSAGRQTMVAGETVTTESADTITYSWSVLPATGPGGALPLLATAALATLLLGGGALAWRRRPS